MLINGQKVDHLRNARFEAKRAAKLLTEATGMPVPVAPLVVLVGTKEITVRERPADVFVLSDSRFVRWLEKRKVVFSDEALRRVLLSARNPMTWSPGQHAPVDSSDTFAALRREVRSARRVRLGWLVGATGLSAGVAWQAFAAMSEHFTKLAG